jgi:FO synthase
MTLGRVLAERASGRGGLSDEDAMGLLPAMLGEADHGPMLEAARGVRDRAWGRRITYSPKVFLPVTNLCRNRCDYCSFRRSPGDEGEWTMTPAEIDEALCRARDVGCAEALLCLGDKPEKAFGAYRRTLATLGHDETVSYLVWASKLALERGLLPHTNAGILTREDMARLKPLNASLGLMLESASDRLCEPGMPHHRAPDKRPAVRLKMLDEAGELGIPFTTGILIGIGETERERVEALLAIRALHRRHGHIQEVIVQNFRARPGIAMETAPDPTGLDLSRTLAAARLVLDDEISVQAPPNLSPGATRELIDAGLNDWGGISPVTPDYINHRHPWPEIDALAEGCAQAGYALSRRLCIYPSYVARPGFLEPSLAPHVRQAAQRLEAL